MWVLPLSADIISKPDIIIRKCIHYNKTITFLNLNSILLLTKLRDAVFPCIPMWTKVLDYSQEILWSLDFIFYYFMIMNILACMYICKRVKSHSHWANLPALSHIFSKYIHIQFCEQFTWLEATHIIATNFLKVLVAFIVILLKISSLYHLKKKIVALINSNGEMCNGKMIQSIWRIYQVLCHTCDILKLCREQREILQAYEKYKGLILLKSELEQSQKLLNLPEYSNAIFKRNLLIWKF